MRPLTLFRYLSGDLEAARSVAARPGRSIAIGLLFVTSAAIAREYDGEYLPAEPIHLALPFLGGLGGAVASGTLLYGASRIRRGTSPGYATMLARWTALFLWTAPLAWLYAFPWERLLSERDAAIANMLTLGVVATWRVALSVRFGSMLFGASTGAVAAILLGVGAPLVLLGLVQNVLPLLFTMGGGRLPEGMAVAAAVSGWLFLPSLGLALAMPALALRSLYDRSERWQAAELGAPAAVGDGSLVLAFVAIGTGVPMLVVGQREQAHAHVVQSAIDAGDAQVVIEALEGRGRGDFPPNWLPRPRGIFPWAGHEPLLLDLLDAADAHPRTPRWVRASWLAALGEAAHRLAFEEGPRRRLLSRLVTCSDDELRTIDPSHHMASDLEWLNIRDGEPDAELLDRVLDRLGGSRRRRGPRDRE